MNVTMNNQQEAKNKYPNWLQVNSKNPFGGGDKLWGSSETRSETVRFRVRWGFHFVQKKIFLRPGCGSTIILKDPLKI